MKFITRATRFAVAVLCLGIFAENANATLLSIDYAANSGDNWITRDTVSGLDWLDVSLTVNQTIDQVRTGTWYQNGFRYATKAEVATLFLHAGTPDDGFDVAVTHPQESLTLAELLGPTLLSSGRVTVAGFTGTDFFGNDITLQNHPLGTSFAALLGKIDYLEILSSTYGEAHFTGGQPLSDQADATYGSFLVRTVPEPNAILLLLGGLVALLGIRSKPYVRNCAV